MTEDDRLRALLRDTNYFTAARLDAISQMPNTGDVPFAEPVMGAYRSLRSGCHVQWRNMRPGRGPQPRKAGVTHG